MCGDKGNLEKIASYNLAEKNYKDKKFVRRPPQQSEDRIYQEPTHKSYAASQIGGNQQIAR